MIFFENAETLNQHSLTESNKCPQEAQVGIYSRPCAGTKTYSCIGMTETLSLSHNNRRNE